MIRITTVIGARPQFIKASPLSRAIADFNRQHPDTIRETVIHTGQHFDHQMSQVFFDELGLAEPDVNLGVSGLSHGAMTGRMLELIEDELKRNRPDWLLVYGDTNSTLAGALAAAKLHIPVAHVEAGLRSFNRQMPEELNRILTDRLSDKLFCPTETAVNNLVAEGVVDGVYNVGDVMFDAVQYYREMATQRVGLERWHVKPGNYVLCTIHRAENTDDLSRLGEILEALRDISHDLPVILPLHPRTRQVITGGIGLHSLDGINVIEPISYLEMLRLESAAVAIFTDSGGVQKEAYFHQIPCITLRDETEWVETVASGWNTLVGAQHARIMEAYGKLTEKPPLGGLALFGNGSAAEQIVRVIVG